MTAKQAREKAEPIANDKIEAQYNQIKFLIGLAVERGEFSIDYKGSVEYQVKLRLEKDGYRVSHVGNSIKQTEAKISW